MNPPPPEYPPTQLWTGRVLVRSVVPNPEQPRTEFNSDLLGLLSESMEEMQIQPILVIPFTDPQRPEVQWMIVDGERRWRGMQRLGSLTILVCFQPGITLANIHEKSFAANFCRAGHTHLETARAIDKQYRAGKTYDYIAKLVGKTQAWALMEHKLLRLAPELMPLVDSKNKKERMSAKTGALLADLPHDKQREQWRKLQNLSAATQFTQLRFSGDIKDVAANHRGRQRSDSSLLVGHLRNAGRELHVVANVPRATLFDLCAGEVSLLEAVLVDIEAQIGVVRGRLAEIKQTGI